VTRRRLANPSSESSRISRLAARGVAQRIANVLCERLVIADQKTARYRRKPLNVSVAKMTGMLFFDLLIINASSFRFTKLVVGISGSASRPRAYLARFGFSDSPSDSDC